MILKYTEHLKNSLKENLAYRTNYFFQLGGRLLSVTAQVYVWSALLGSSGQTTSSMGVITLQDMTSYVIISVVISTLVNNNVIGIIEERIRDGLIAFDLIRPMSFQLLTFCRAFGISLFNFLFSLLPVLIFGILVFGLNSPSLPNILLFLWSLLNGIIISFLVSYSVGLLGFVFISIWHLSRFLTDLTLIFSGSWIPLWFFPGFLAKIAEYLPFRMIYFVPTSIFLEKYTTNEGLTLILIQLIWIGILYVLSRGIWARVVHKIVIQGG